MAHRLCRVLSPAVAALSAFLVLLSLPAGASSAQSAVSRITQAVDDSRTVPLPGNVHPLAIAGYDHGEADPSSSTGRIQLVLKRSAGQQMALNQYLADLQNRDSASYHKWLTPTQFGTAFGISDSDLAIIVRWLQSHGFAVDSVSPARNIVEFSGTFAQIQSAFHTSIHTLSVGGKAHLANISNPSIPVALQPVVAGVGPLNDFHPTPLNQPAAPATYDASTKSIKPQFTLFDNTTPVLYTDPADAATIYDTPNSTLNPNYSGTTYDGTGINLGIVGDSNVSLADITNYRVAFLNETAATANIPTVVVDGNDPGLNGDEPEGLLDNEIAGGLAPKAKIYFYTSSDTDLQSGLFDAIFRAINDNTVSILNISFGACEANLGSAGNAGLLEGFEQAAAQGISVVVASGDSGSAACDSSGEPAAQYGLAVNAIASTPYTIAVGGTDYDVLAQSFSTYVESANSGNPPYYRTALSYIPEEPWNDSTKINNTLANNEPLLLQGSTNVIAAGGGASAVYPKPSFQTALTPADSARDVPDVSLLAANGLYGAAWVVCADSVGYGADCQTSNGTFVGGARFSGFGGTSTAAPAFAGMLALIEQKTASRLGQANYVLYQLASSKYASVFHDVTTGNNSVYCEGGTTGCGNNSFMTGYDAVTGYDQASGLGSVDVANLAANWNSVVLAGTTTTLSIDGSTSPVHVVHGTGLNFSVGVNPATSGAAAIIATANEVAGGPLNNGQIPVTVTSGTGATTYNGMPGGTYTVYSRYGGDTAHAASTSTPAIDVTITPEPSTTALKVSAYDPLTGTSTPGGLTAIPYGSEMFLDASVYGTAEGMAGTIGIATGTVSFSDGSTVLGQSKVSDSNIASYPAISGGTFPAFSLGTHSLGAAYSGDPSYNANTSAPVGITIVQNTSSVIATASSTSIPSSASTTLTITVQAPGLGSGPTGSVTLTANGATLATLTGLVAAPAGGVPAESQVKYALAGAQLVAGSNTITATYSGDGNYRGSSGSVVVNVTPSRFTLNNSGALTFAAGATTGNTATITATPINSFVGAINLTCAVAGPTGATSPATCTVPSPVTITGSSSVTTTLAVATTSSTTPGSYAVVVIGKDAATGAISVSTTVDVTVTAPPANPAIALSNSGNITIAPGAITGNTSTITITPSGAFTGAVGLTCAVTTSISAPNDPPSCSIPATVNVTGATAVTATVSVASTAPTSAALHNPFTRLSAPAAGSVLAFTIFFGIPRRRRRGLHLLSLLSVAFFAILGCGNSGSTNPGNTGTSAGSYVVTVTATATGIAPQTTIVNVTVN